MILNTITHKYISEEINKKIAQWKDRGGKLAVIDAAALIESGRGDDCDIIIGVTAPAEDRAARVMIRDGITRKQAEARIKSQQPDSFYEDNCDHIIKNIYSTSAEFKNKCREYVNVITGGEENAG